MVRKNYSTDAKWESIIGYSRAVRIGNIIEVSGTVAINDGQVIGLGDPYLQTKQILGLIQKSLQELNASLTDVIRTRIYVTDAAFWPEVGKAHFEFFKDIMPATSMVEVSALISNEYLVEIEASAVVA